MALLSLCMCMWQVNFDKWNPCLYFLLTVLHSNEKFDQI